MTRRSCLTWRWTRSAPTGSYRNLFCAVDVPEAGRVIPHTIAAGGILRVVPPKKAEASVAAAEGKGR